MSLSEIDTLLFFFVNKNLSNVVFDAAMPLITNNYYFLILPPAIWLAVKDKKKFLIPVLLTVVSVLLSDWIAHLLKHLIERPRPCHALEAVNLLAGCSNSFSMPSNHAANSSAIIFALSYKSRKWVRWLLVAVAALVGFSRLYVGVHYPSDVIAGAFIGIFVSVSVIYLYEGLSLRYKARPYYAVFLFSLLFFGLFRIYYITQGIVDLSPDEAHYWEWSRRLDLSYYSKGPMIAYLIALGTAVFGDNVFGIRIMAVLFSALSSIVIYLLGKRLFDERIAAAAGILMQIVPLYSVYGVLFTIDSPFIFFWILSLLLFWEAIDKTKNTSPPPIPPPQGGMVRGGVKVRVLSSEFWSWLLLGVSIGLGLLTKYTMTFFYVCAFLFLVSSKKYRNFLLTKGPYVCLITSLIVFSPVIIWNASNDWVTFKHTAGQAHVADGIKISLKSFGEFIGSQFGVITPIILILLIYSLFKLRKAHAGHFLFWFSIPVIVFFILKSLQAKVQANWALPGYAAGFIAFSALFIGRWESFKKSLKGVVIFAVILSFGATMAVHSLAVFKLPPKLDPSSRIRGWKDLGTEVSRLSDELSKKGPFFILSDRYQVSSELAFYVKGRPVTYCVNIGRRMNQYDLWPGFEDSIHFNAIFVTIGEAQMPEDLGAGFKNCEKNVFKAYANGVKLRDYSIFACYDFKGMKRKGAESY